MNRFIWATIWLLAATVTAVAQSTTPATNHVTLEKRADGWWALWSNTPPMFKISTSTNMATWQVWMTKSSGESLKSIELKLASSNDYRFLKFEPLTPYYPPPPTNLTRLMTTLTNTLNTLTPNKGTQK